LAGRSLDLDQGVPDSGRRPAGVVRAIAEPLPENHMKLDAVPALIETHLDAATDRLLQFLRIPSI
jgi:hypothetical protein